MFTYSIKLDKKKDIKNWRDWCNHTSYWFDWTKNINPEYFYIVQKLKSCTLEESYDIMDEFIDKLYIDKGKEIDLTIEYANLYFQKWFQKACECMEKTTWKPLYRNDFTIYLTSFPRWPYNYEEWYLLIPFFWDVHRYLWFFLHELQHFQIHAYYSDIFADISNEQFHDIKESMTVILNAECSEFLVKDDKWYPNHQKLRKNILKYRLKNHDFEKTLNFTKKLLTKID